MSIEILDLELDVSFIILIGEITTTLVLHYRLPNRKRILGIILVGISLGVIGLLAHAVYTLFGLLAPPNYFHSYMAMILMLVIIPSLIFLFLCHSVSVYFGIKLIRKYGKKGNSHSEESL